MLGTSSKNIIFLGGKTPSTNPRKYWEILILGNDWFTYILRWFSLETVHSPSTNPWNDGRKPWLRSMETIHFTYRNDWLLMVKLIGPIPFNKSKFTAWMSQKVGKWLGSVGYFTPNNPPFTRRWKQLIDPNQLDPNFRPGTSMWRVYSLED